MKEKIKKFYQENEDVINFGSIVFSAITITIFLVIQRKQITGREIVAVKSKMIDETQNIRILFRNGTSDNWMLPPE